jgi:hypothetical protein
MLEDLLARMTDDMAEWLIAESEAAVSEVLDGLGPIELQFLAGVMIAKGEERPRSDEELERYLRASTRLLDRAVAAGFGR